MDKQWQELAGHAPIDIPADASVTPTQKQGYDQVKFQWRTGNYTYVARWHSPLPGATIVTQPSWEVARIRRGLGYGPRHAPRVCQLLTQHGHWIDESLIHQAAWRLGHGKERAGDRDLLRMVHFLGQPHGLNHH